MTLEPGWVASALLTLMLVFFKIWSGRNDRRMEQIEKHQEELARMVETLRVEVYKDFARNDTHNDIRSDMQRMFEKIDALSQSLHTHIGQFQGERKTKRK